MGLKRGVTVWKLEPPRPFLVVIRKMDFARGTASPGYKLLPLKGWQQLPQLREPIVQRPKYQAKIQWS
jgi:hypothetical protein